jgi:hypothetical protein
MTTLAFSSPTSAGAFVRQCCNDTLHSQAVFDELSGANRCTRDECCVALCARGAGALSSALAWSGASTQRCVALCGWAAAQTASRGSLHAFIANCVYAAPAPFARVLDGCLHLILASMQPPRAVRAATWLELCLHPAVAAHNLPCMRALHAVCTESGTAQRRAVSRSLQVLRSAPAGFVQRVNAITVYWLGVLASGASVTAPSAEDCLALPCGFSVHECVQAAFLGSRNKAALCLYTVYADTSES